MRTTPKRTRTIKVEHLARVEGEGALHIKTRGSEVQEVRLNIFEPPRFFEAFLRGRSFTEAPDITARICGICPIAYQMSACQAMEAICGIEVRGALRHLRHLIYCGEWIESHALHVFMLHLPDFLGYEDAIRMAADHRDLVQNALEIKKVGNEIMRLMGGREIHPINIRLGGFYSVPSKADLESLVDKLIWCRDTALSTIPFAADLPFPSFEQDYEFVALRHPDEYAILSGRLVSSSGLDIEISRFNEHFFEEHVEHSTALHGRMRGRGAYLVGPMARFNLNFHQLSPAAQDAATRAGVAPPCRNPFKSIIIRLVEIVHACDTALKIIDSYEKPERPFIDVEAREGTGFGCTEAPRGICWHRYTIDAAGIIQEAQIVPPTAQNQPMIEDDLRAFVGGHLHLSDDELQWKCEQTIRNYDPCISCACHFLKLQIERN